MAGRSIQDYKDDLLWKWRLEAAYYTQWNSYLRGLPWSRPVATRRAFGGTSPKFLLCPPKFFCSQKNLFQKYNKNKIRAPLKMYFAPPNLKTWLRACREAEQYAKLRHWSRNSERLVDRETARFCQMVGMQTFITVHDAIRKSACQNLLWKRRAGPVENLNLLILRERWSWDGWINWSKLQYFYKHFYITLNCWTLDEASAKKLLNSWDHCQHVSLMHRWSEAK